MGFLHLVSSDFALTKTERLYEATYNSVFRTYGVENGIFKSMVCDPLPIARSTMRSTRH